MKQIIALKLILSLLLINISVIVIYDFDGKSLGKLFVTLLTIVAALLLIISFYNQIKKKINIHLYFKVVYGLILLWTLIMIARNFSLNSKDLLTIFGHYAVGALTWLTPLAVIFGLNIMNWLKLFSFIEKILVIGIILGIAFYPFRFENGIEDWLHFMPIIIFTSLYQSKRLNIIGILSIFMLILLSITSSHRTNFVYIAIIGFYYALDYFRNNQTNIYKKFIAVAIIFPLLFFAVIKLQKDINKLSQNKEISTDTRTFLFEELFADMSNTELITGRGVLGTYYSPYFQYTTDHGLGGDNPDRSVSEVGYLFMILKGGYILLTLYLLILIPAAYLGIFKSHNMIARMCGYFILLYLVLWALSYSPTFVPKFIVLWMAAGTCISPTARNMKIERIDLEKSKIII